MFIKCTDYNGNEGFVNVDNISIIERYTIDQYKCIVVGVDVLVYITTYDAEKLLDKLAYDYNG